MKKDKAYLDLNIGDTFIDENGDFLQITGLLLLKRKKFLITRYVHKVDLMLGNNGTDEIKNYKSLAKLSRYSTQNSL